MEYGSPGEGQFTSNQMRERGCRMVQIWVPDVKAANFEIEARRQAAAVAEGDRRSDDQAFIESVSAP